MTTVMLVAGDSTAAFKKFMDERGAIQVVEAFETLNKYSDKLINGYHSADKLIYLYRDPSVNIRREMQILKSLLVGNSFFKVKEVIFYCVDSTETEDGVNFFEQVKIDVIERAQNDRAILAPEFNLILSKTELTLDIIYNSLLGFSTANKVNNSFVNIYRVKKGSDSKKSYEPEDTRDIALEPFSFKSIKRYESLRDSIVKADPGQPMVDPSEKEMEKLDPTLEPIVVKDIRTNLKVAIFSGNRKSGVSTMVTAMTVSTAAANKKVLSIDLTKNKGLEFVFKCANLPFSGVDVKNFLSNNLYIQETLIGLLSKFSNAIKFDLLTNLLNRSTGIGVDVILIDVHSEDLERVLSLFRGFNPKVFLLSSPVKNDIDEVKGLFTSVKGADLILNRNMQYQKYFGEMEPEIIKSYLPNVNRLVKPIEFEDFDLDDYLARTLLGVV